MKKMIILMASAMLICFVSCKKEDTTTPGNKTSTTTVEEKNKSLIGSWELDSIKTEQSFSGLYDHYLFIYSDSLVTISQDSVFKVISEWHTEKDTLFALYNHKYTISKDFNKLTLEGDESTIGLNERYKYYYHKI